MKGNTLKGYFLYCLVKHFHSLFFVFLITFKHVQFYIFLQESLVEKTCENFELAKVNTFSDYQTVANNSESLLKIEECMNLWIKQIEQVSLTNKRLWLTFS